MKTLLIKALGITSPSWRGYNSGVGRSTQKLLNALNNVDTIPFDIKVYVNGLGSLNFDFFNWKFKKIKFPIPSNIGNEITKLEPYWRTHFVKHDLLHIPHNIDVVCPGENYVVTLHDVIAYDNARNSGDSITVERWERMARNARAIMTCSDYSKSEIVNKLNVPSDRVHVVYWGTSDDIFYINDESQTKERLNSLGISMPYFVSISCAHPRKNIRTLLKAYREFAKSNPEHNLVLVWGGFPDDLNKEYFQEISDGKIKILDYVTDEDLRALYNGASCTMFPTLSEGFGFPILESFACNTPVMTCKNTCLPEVGQNAAIYVGEYAIDEMVDVMKMFENNSYDHSTFEVRAKKILEKFSWSNTAKEYIEFYQKYM